MKKKQVEKEQNNEKQLPRQETTLGLVGDILAKERCTRSKLYAPDFETEFRKKKE